MISALPPKDGHAAELSAHDALAAAFPKTPEGRLIFTIALAFSAFQLATAAHLLDPPSQLVRAIHVGFVTALIFPLLAALLNKGRWIKALAWSCSVISAGIAIYQCYEYADLILRAGDPLSRDIVFGVVALTIVFAASWVLMGPALPIISGVFLLY